MSSSLYGFSDLIPLLTPTWNQTWWGQLLIASAAGVVSGLIVRYLPNR